MKNKSFKIFLIVGIIIVIGFILFTIIGFLLTIEPNSSNNNYLKNIDYNISNKFEKSKYTDSINYYYFDEENDISCSFDVAAYDSYDLDDGREYLEENIYYNNKDKVSEIEEVNINNNKWYKMTVTNRDEHNYYYAIKKGEVFYDLKYTITDYLNGDRTNIDNFCAKEKDSVIASVTLK